MNSMMSNVGREIDSVQSDYTESMEWHYGKIVLEHQQLRGSESMVDCFFAVQYNDDGVEIMRRWIGQGVQITWKVSNE